MSYHRPAFISSLLLCLLLVAAAHSSSTTTILIPSHSTPSLVSNKLHQIRAGSVEKNVSQQKSLKTSPHDDGNRSLLVFQSASFMTMLSSTLIAFAPASALVTKMSSAEKATSTLSILSASAAVMEIISSPFVGRLLDALGRKPVFMAILTAICLSQGLVVATSESVWSLCMCKVVGVFGVGLFFQIIGQAVLSDLTGSNPEKLSSALGMQSALIGAGFFVAALGGGQLISRFGVSPTYAVAALLTLMNIVMVGFAMPETLQSASSSQPKSQQPKKKLFSSLLTCTRILTRHKQPIPALALVFALQCLPNFAGDFFQIFCKTEWNLDTTAFTRFVAFIGILGVVSNVWGSVLVRQLGMKRYTLLASACSILPALGAVIFDFRGLLAGQLVGFLTMAQSLGVMGTMVAEAKKQGIPVGELTGERASLIALAKVIGPIFYSTLYVQGKRLGNFPKLPFVFNTLLGITVFGICNAYL